MIVGIEGSLGSGKTLLMTRYLVKDAMAGRGVFANYGLKHIKHSVLDMKTMLSNNSDLQDVSVGIDEFTVFADCRTSMSNKMITYFILQTRKRNVCLYYTTQDFSMLDKRIIRHTHLLARCTHVKDNDDYRIVTFIDRRKDNAIPQSKMFYIPAWFRYYDTNEVISPIE